MIKKVLNYFQKVYAESKKISWPRKKEVKDYFFVVLLISFLVGIYFGVLDWLIINLFRKLIR